MQTPAGVPQSGGSSTELRKLLLANSAITPCNRVEWQIEDSIQDAQHRSRAHGSQAGTSSGDSRSSSLSPSSSGASSLPFPDLELYDAPVWMLACYALTRLPGRCGDALEAHEALLEALSGFVVLPWLETLEKHLGTSSLDGRGIHKSVAPDGHMRYALIEENIPSVLKPGWYHFKIWAERHALPLPEGRATVSLVDPAIMQDSADVAGTIEAAGDEAGEQLQHAMLQL